MLFEHINILWLLILTLPLFYLAIKIKSPLETIFSKDILKKISTNAKGFSQRVRAILMVISLALLIIALSRPQLDNGEIKVKGQSKSLVVAIDISKSMFLKDLYPNRFEFAKAKFKKLLDNLKETKVALLGFSDRAFLIAPLTSDYSSLRYLTDHLRADYLNQKGTSIMQVLNSANDLMKKKEKKALLIFTDGGDKRDFSKEIDYAKSHNIKVFVYATATAKGALIRDNRGNMVRLKLNRAIKDLALKSGGAYMEYSLNGSDMKELARVVESKLTATKTKEETIKNRVELFYYPAILALVTLFMARFSLPDRERKIAKERV